ncbi:unnamed protein product [Heterobilharzia americana]|nr:unnamed protein product [Heterobilharzia americana]
MNHFYMHIFFSQGNPNIEIQLDLTTEATVSDLAETSISSETSESSAWPVGFEPFSENRHSSQDVENTSLTPSLNEQRHSLISSYLDPPAKNVKRDSFGGSMELRTPTEPKPQVSDLSWRYKRTPHLVNGSSINLNDKTSQ